MTEACRFHNIVLQGWSARGQGGMKIQQYFRDGPFAEQVRVPTENAIPIGAIDSAEAGRWCAINTLLIAYDGLLESSRRVLLPQPMGWFSSPSNEQWETAF
jgi:alcohol dehydrogenase